MDLNRTPNEEKVRLSRMYFLGGFAFLPFLWLVNVVWFFKEAFLKETFDGQLDIRTYLLRSLCGLLFWFGGLTAWIVIYQRNRGEWGLVGDKLSFLIPLGEP